MAIFICANAVITSETENIRLAIQVRLLLQTPNTTGMTMWWRGQDEADTTLMFITLSASRPEADSRIKF